MSEFVDCRTCKTDCVRADGNYGYTFCDKYTHPPMTNADRIRAMSDEEMAEFISSIPMCVGKVDEDLNCEIDVCKECFLKWLQQPAEEEDHA